MKTIYTPKFRTSFVNVFQPDNYGKYSITMLVNKNMGQEDQQKFANMKLALKEARDQKWPDPNSRPKIQSPIKDGDTDLMQDGTLRKDKYPEIAGHWVIRLVSGTKPGVVDGSTPPQPIGDMNRDDFYSGCFAHATVHAYSYGPSKKNPQIKNGVGFGLDNLQKLGDGDAFSGKPKATDQFSGVEDYMDTNDVGGTTATPTDDFLN